MKEEGEQRATRNLELRASVDAKAAVKETSGEEVREEQRLQGGREVEERKAIVVGQTAPGAAGQEGGRHGVLWDRTTQRRNQRGPRSVFGVQTTPVS